MTAHGLRQLSGSVSSCLYHRTWNVYVWVNLCGSSINYTLGTHQSDFEVFCFVLSWGWNKGEDPKGRKRRSGNFFHPHQFDNIILTKNVIHRKETSINIQHLTPVHEKCFCCLCHIIKTEVTFDFRKNNQKLPATPILSLCWAEVKHRIVCWTIMVGNRSNKCN